MIRIKEQWIHYKVSYIDTYEWQLVEHMINPPLIFHIHIHLMLLQKCIIKNPINIPLVIYVKYLKLWIIFFLVSRGLSNFIFWLGKFQSFDWLSILNLWMGQCHLHHNSLLLLSHQLGRDNKLHCWWFSQEFLYCFDILGLVLHSKEKI